MVRGAGAEGVDQESPGDLVVTVTVESHPRYERRGDDLLATASAAIIHPPTHTHLLTNWTNRDNPLHPS